ncbi:MAG: hypothetical protein ACRYFS_17420 [Janthinobacterium lividum]
MTQTTETNSDFSANTLQVLHRVLIRLRSLAYEGTEPKTIGRMLDDIEYLGILAIRSRTDDSPKQISDFREHLQSLEIKYTGFGHLTAVFDQLQQITN